MLGGQLVEQGLASLQFLQEIQTTMHEDRIQPEQFEDRIIFISMYNGIDWEKQETKKLVFRILQMLRRTPKGHWSFFGTRN